MFRFRSNLDMRSNLRKFVALVLCHALCSVSVVAHTVTFDLGDHGFLTSGESVQTVPDGGTAIAPSFRVSPGWSFVGWDRPYIGVTEDLVVTAEFLESSGVERLDDELFRMDDKEASLYWNSVSVCGDIAVVGVIAREDSKYVGYAYVYIRLDGEWHLESELIPNSVSEQSFFGRAVSVSGDTILVGAMHDKVDGLTRGGVYVFVRTQNGWEQQARIAGDGGSFGCSVSLLGDRALIGAERASAAYLFRRVDGVWSEEAILAPNDGAVDRRFGCSVSLGEETALIGAYYDVYRYPLFGSLPDPFENRNGSAYVFHEGGHRWFEHQKLTPDEPNGYAGFGHSVSLDGRTAVIGSRGLEIGEDGSVFFYEDAGLEWVEELELNGGRSFGASVSVSGDIAVIGDHAGSTASSDGSARVFVREFEGQDSIWDEVWGLRSVGRSVSGDLSSAVSIDGDTVIVGSRRSVNGGVNGFDAIAFDIGVAPFSVDFDLGGKSNRIGGGFLSQTVDVNSSALAPTVEANTGWSFHGWDKDFTGVRKDMTVRALYDYDDSTDDGDSVTDGWELIHFGATNVTDGTIDSDGDGDLDVEEFESGNDPMDRSDYFRVMEEAVSPMDGQVTLRFSTNDDVGSRRYKIWYTDDLGGDWIEHSIGAFRPDAGDSTEKTFAAPGGADAYFFKVEAFIAE